jgi:hypothetical protein
MFEPFLAALHALQTHFEQASLNGFPLLVALLMAFFAGAFFVLRRLRLDAALLWRHVLNPTSRDAAPPAAPARVASPHAARALGIIAALYFSMAACMLYFSLALTGPGIEEISSASGFTAGILLASGVLALVFAIVEKRRAATAGEATAQGPRA